MIVICEEMYSFQTVSKHEHVAFCRYEVAFPLCILLYHAKVDADVNITTRILKINFGK